MAKIVETNTILTISKLVKTSDNTETLELPEDFTDTVLELVAQLLGSDYVVELTVA
ncbi:MAG: hypothetical protein M0R77_19860 [Gammaproteobacteria bacterium]|nr:hypothetical protein [Gammaproteobacteria bacterium]